MKLTDFPFDVVFAVLEMLSSATQGACSSVSHLFFLLVNEVQRRPMLISDVGMIGEIMPKLRQKLLTKPAIAIMFSTGDLASPAVKEMIHKQLPHDIQLIGAHTHAVQATNSDCKMGFYVKH